jgi:arylsulfatase A-like enzyme
VRAETLSRLIRSSAIACAAFGLAAGLTPWQAAYAQPAPRRPNVIVILADDLGYNDISLNGNPLVKTPNIDSIARDGARLIDGYAGDAICAPSRAALITGRYPQRFGFEYLPHVPYYSSGFDGSTVPELHKAMLLGEPKTPPAPKINGLPDDEITLAQALKGGGYRTALFGKWHLGGDPSKRPDHRGFDEAIYYADGTSMHAPADDPAFVSAKMPWDGTDYWLWSHLKPNIIRGTGMQAPTPIKGWLSDELAGAASRFIDKNKTRPFFIYLALPEAHTPLQAPRAIYERNSFIKDEKTRVYYSMIEAMDADVGQVLKALKRNKLDKDTIVIFTSDNGGAPYTRIPWENLPYRGFKMTFFRGGVTVPYLIKWPGHIPADQVVTGVTSSLDIFPTALAAAAIPLPQGRTYDGIDLLPTLTGVVPNTLDQRTLYWRNEDYFLLRKGRYTLQTSKYPQRTLLFDLERDPTEKMDLAPFLPQTVKELQADLANIDRQMRPPAWAPVVRSAFDVDGVEEERGDSSDFVFWTN